MYYVLTVLITTYVCTNVASERVQRFINNKKILKLSDVLDGLKKGSFDFFLIKILSRFLIQ